MVKIKAKQSFHDSATGMMSAGQEASVDQRTADQLEAIDLIEIVREDDGNPIPEHKSKGVTLKDHTEKKEGEPVLKQKPGATTEKAEEKKEQAEIKKAKQAETPKKKYK